MVIGIGLSVSVLVRWISVISVSAMYWLQSLNIRKYRLVLALEKYWPFHKLSQIIAQISAMENIVIGGRYVYPNISVLVSVSASAGPISFYPISFYP